MEKEMENEIEKESKIAPIDGSTIADEELKKQLALKLSEICNNLNLWPDLQFTEKCKDVIDDAQCGTHNVLKYQWIGDSVIFDKQPDAYQDKLLQMLNAIMRYAKLKNIIRINNHNEIKYPNCLQDTIKMLHEIILHAIEKIKIERPNYNQNNLNLFKTKVEELIQHQDILKYISSVDFNVEEKKEQGDTLTDDLKKIAMKHFKEMGIYPYFKFEFNKEVTKRGFSGIANINFYNNENIPNNYDTLLTAIILNTKSILDLNNNPLHDGMAIAKKLHDLFMRATIGDLKRKQPKTYIDGMAKMYNEMITTLKDKYGKDEYSGQTVDKIINDWENEWKIGEQAEKQKVPGNKKKKNKKKKKSTINQINNDNQSEQNNINTINIGNSINIMDNEQELPDTYQEAKSLSEIITRINNIVKGIPEKDHKKQNSWGISYHYCKELDNYTYMEKVYENLQNILKTHNIDIKNITSKRRDTINNFNRLWKAVKKSRTEEDFDKMSIDTRQFYKDNKFNPYTYNIDFSDLKGNAKEYSEYKQEEINNDIETKSLDSQEEEEKKI